MREYPAEAVMSDALKLAYREHGFPHYLQVFVVPRQRFVAGAAANSATTAAP